MNPRHRSYKELISRVRTQLRARVVLRAIAITMGTAVGSLIMAAVAANYLSGKTGALLILRILPVALTLGAALLFIGRALRAKVADNRIALLIEEKCRLEDRLITAVEFSQDTRDASPAIVDRLVEDVGA